MRIQMKFQKFICIFSIIVGAICFVCGLGFATDIHYLYQCMDLAGDKSSREIYHLVQDFNPTLVKMAIVMIVLSVFLFFTRTSSRRKYYISNYVMIGVLVAFNIVVSIIFIGKILELRKMYFANTDFELWIEYADMFGLQSSTKAFWFDITIFGYSLAIFVSILLVLNTTWKTMLINKENRLLKSKKLMTEVGNV